MSLRDSGPAAPWHGECPHPQFVDSASVSTLAFAQCGPQ
jgi:hypothetical protein